jgi:hypothetical protein
VKINLFSNYIKGLDELFGYMDWTWIFPIDIKAKLIVE